MKHLESIDHIGYAVRDIAETAAPYVAAGWELSEVYNEEVQHAKIAFLKKEGMPTIELVSPLEGESPVDKFLNKGFDRFAICFTRFGIIVDILFIVKRRILRNMNQVFFLFIIKLSIINIELL